MRRLLELAALPPQMVEITDKQAYGLKADSMGIPQGGHYSEVEALATPVPRQVAFANSSEVGLIDLSGTQHNNILGTYLFFNDSGSNTDYSYTDTFGNTYSGNIINDLIKAGMQNNVLNAWEVPDEYISGSTPTGQYNPFSASPVGFLSQIISSRKTGAYTYTPIITVSNNKARYFQSATIRVYNPASGASLLKNIYDLLPLNSDPSATSYSLSWAIAADIRPEGSPIFAWAYNNGGTEQLSTMTEYIKGANWNRYLITGQGISGSYFDKLALNQQRQELAISAGLALAGSALTGFTYTPGMQQIEGLTDIIAGSRATAQRDIPGQQGTSGQTNFGGFGPAGLAITLGGYALASVKQMHQQQLLNAKGICANSILQVGNSEYARDIGKNEFYFVQASYDAWDMQDYDLFLSKYGYNVGNMHIGTQHFWSRKHFIFIRVNDISIKSENAGQEMLDKVALQLKAGVRIWRTKPEIAKLMPDGNREPGVV